MMNKIYNTFIVYSEVLLIKCMIRVTEKHRKKYGKDVDMYLNLRKTENSMTQAYNNQRFVEVSDRARNKFIAEFRRYINYVNSYACNFI